MNWKAKLFFVAVRDRQEEKREVKQGLEKESQRENDIFGGK